MIGGAFRRVTTVELAAYVICATGTLVIALLLPGLVKIPDWLAFVAMVGVQLWLYKRFYGRI